MGEGKGGSARSGGNARRTMNYYFVHRANARAARNGGSGTQFGLDRNNNVTYTQNGITRRI